MVESAAPIPNVRDSLRSLIPEVGDKTETGWTSTQRFAFRFAFVFFLPAIAAWIVAGVFLVLSRMVAADPLRSVCLAFAAVTALAALYWTATAWFHHWTTETDVTNMRVVHKTGFIKRRAFEMSLDKVESVDVIQSIMGRLFDYGDVTIMGVGEGKETITTIASPLAFRNSITAR